MNNSDVDYCELHTSTSSVTGQARCCKLNDNNLEMTCITREATSTDPSQDYVSVDKLYDTMTYNGFVLSHEYSYNGMIF